MLKPEVLELLPSPPHEHRIQHALEELQDIPYNLQP